MRGGFISGAATFKGKDLELVSDENGVPKGKTVALSLSTPIKKGLHLGTELGVNAFESYLSQKLTLSSEPIEYSGWNYVNQFYIVLVPEYRFLKGEWLFIQAGAGLYKDYDNYFSGAVLRSSGFQTIDGRWFTRDSEAGFLVGGGLCPQLTKRLGLSLAFRYTWLPVDTSQRQSTNLKYELLNVNCGLSFRLAQ